MRNKRKYHWIIALDNIIGIILVIVLFSFDLGHSSFQRYFYKGLGLFAIIIPYLVILGVSLRKLGKHKASKFVFKVFDLIGLFYFKSTYYLLFLFFYIIALAIFFVTPIIMIQRLPLLVPYTKAVFYWAWLLQLLCTIYGHRYIRKLLKFISIYLRKMGKDIYDRHADHPNFDFVNRNNLRRIGYFIALLIYVIVNTQKFSAPNSVINPASTSTLISLWNSLKDVTHEVLLTFIIVDSLLSINESKKSV